MNSIRKRGETYQAQVRLSGGRASSATFKTKAEAQIWVREQAFTLAQLPKNRDERTTLGDVIERFISDVIPLRQSGDIEALRLGVVCRHPIASRRLAEINSFDLCSYRDQRFGFIVARNLNNKLQVYLSQTQKLSKNIGRPIHAS